MCSITPAEMRRQGIADCLSSTTQTRSATSKGEALRGGGLVWKLVEAEDRSPPGCVRVGVTGRVLATDIDPRFLETLSYPNLEVRRHDIRREDLPNRQFDLAHVRLVLMHLPDPEMAVRRIVEALKPGGWLVAEEFDCLTFLPDPAVNPSEVNLKTRHAFHRVLSARGVDLRYGRLLPQKLQANGLVNVGAEASISTYSGKSAGTNFVRFNFEEMRESMLGSRLISREEFEADLRRIDDQNCLMPLWMMWTVWGQRP